VAGDEMEMRVYGMTGGKRGVRGGEGRWGERGGVGRGEVDAGGGGRVLGTHIMWV